MDFKRLLKEALSGSYDPFSISMPAINIFETAEATVAKLCTHAEQKKC